MALGRQSDMLLSWSDLPRAPGHVFYDKLQTVLIAPTSTSLSRRNAPRRGRPSLPPGRYFRMLLIGYFEGIDSERGLEWRGADSLSLREFLRLGERERVSDHSWLSRTRSRLPLEMRRLSGSPHGLRRGTREAHHRVERQGGTRCLRRAHGRWACRASLSAEAEGGRRQGGW
jgi:hypothetical protein